MTDLTRGSVLSHVLTMAGPIFSGLILVLLCGLIDLYFVSGLGEAAIAGVGAAGNAGFIVSALTQIVNVGTLAAVSHAVGRGDRTDANIVFNQSVALSIACATFLLAGGLAAAGPYIRSVAADAATAKAGVDYLIWFMPALALQFVMLAMSSALRGLGVVRPTMYVQVLIVAVNVALAPALIIGWPMGHGMGVKGAGLASSLAVAIGVVVLSLYLRRPGNYFWLDPTQWRPNPKIWRRILGVGLPAGAEFAIMFVYMATIYYALGKIGPAAQAGFSVGSRVLGLIQVPAMAIAFAAAPIIGQNLGAGDNARIRQTVRHVIVLTTVVMVITTFIVSWRPDLLIEGFTQDRATIDEGARFLKLVSLNLVAQGLIFVCSSTFQGLGNTKPQLVSSTVRLVTYMIPTLWLSNSVSFRAEQVWYLSIVTTSLQALIGFWLMRRELGVRLHFERFCETASPPEAAEYDGRTPFSSSEQRTSS